MSKQLTLFFVGLKDKNECVTIQSAAATCYDEAIAAVLAKPVIENVVAYCRMISANEVLWVNLNEQD